MCRSELFNDPGHCILNHFESVRALHQGHSPVTRGRSQAAPHRRSKAPFEETKLDEVHVALSLVY